MNYFIIIPLIISLLLCLIYLANFYIKNIKDVKVGDFGSGEKKRELIKDYLNPLKKMLTYTFFAALVGVVLTFILAFSLYLNEASVFNEKPINLALIDSITSGSITAALLYLFSKILNKYTLLVKELI